MVYEREKVCMGESVRGSAACRTHPPAVRVHPLGCPDVIGLVGEAAVFDHAVSICVEQFGAAHHLQQGGVQVGEKDLAGRVLWLLAHPHSGCPLLLPVSPQVHVVPKNLQHELGPQVLPARHVLEVVRIGARPRTFRGTAQVVRYSTHHLARPHFPTTHHNPLGGIVRGHCCCEVPLQGELQLGPELKEREAGVEVHVIRVVHQVLMTFQIKELSNQGLFPGRLLSRPVVDFHALGQRGQQRHAEGGQVRPQLPRGRTHPHRTRSQC